MEQNSQQEPVYYWARSYLLPGWRYPSATLKQMILDNMVVFGKDETTIPRRKYLLSENMYENVPSLYYNGKSGSTDVSNLEMKTTYVIVVF